MTTRPNGRPQADAERPPWEATGVFEETATPLEVQIGNRSRSGHDLRTAISGAAYELSVDHVRYPTAATTRQGDLIELDERAFTVNEVRRDGMSLRVFGLVSVDGG